MSGIYRSRDYKYSRANRYLWPGTYPSVAFKNAADAVAAAITDAKNTLASTSARTDNPSAAITELLDLLSKSTRTDNPTISLAEVAAATPKIVTSDAAAVKVVEDGYCPLAVTFDGTNDALSSDGALAGLADGRQGYIAFFFVLRSSGQKMVLANNNDKVRVEFSSDLIHINVSGAAGSLDFWSDTALTHDVLYHCAASWDVDFSAGNKKKHLFINRVDAIDNITDGDAAFDIDYSATNWGVGCYGGDTSVARFNGDLGALLFGVEYIDITIGANLDKLITQSLAGVNPGSNGSLVTGTAAVIYLNGPANEFATNRGTGGGLTLIGTLADAGTQPPCGPATVVKTILLRTDNPTISITDTVATLKALLTRTDNPTAVISDAVNLLKVMFTRTDNPTAVITEAAATLKTVLARADNPSVSITDTVNLLKALLTRTDNPTVIATDAARTIAVTLARADAVAAAITEIASTSVTLIASDAAAVAITETKVVKILFVLADALALAITETCSIAGVLSRADNPTITLSELIQVLAKLARIDTAIVAINEARLIVNTLARTDTPSVAVADAVATLKSTLVRSDNPAAAIVDATQTLLAQLARVDNPALSVADSATAKGLLALADALVVILADVATVQFGAIASLVRTVLLRASAGAGMMGAGLGEPNLTATRDTLTGTAGKDDPDLLGSRGNVDLEGQP